MMHKHKGMFFICSYCSFRYSFTSSEVDELAGREFEKSPSFLLSHGGRYRKSFEVWKFLVEFGKLFFWNDRVFEETSCSSQ
jgi:hypothetical protein